MKPAAARLAALVSAEVGGGASKSQAGTPSIVFGEDSSRSMKTRAIFSDVSKKGRYFVYLYTGVHINGVGGESKEYGGPTFGESVYSPTLASSPGAPVRIALGCVSSLDVPLNLS